MIIENNKGEFEMNTTIRKFEKAGAKVDRLANCYRATFLNGKACYFDGSLFWKVLGYDNGSQEMDRSFYDNATQIIKSMKRN